MKRKISLLLAVVMAMTMTLGMSVTAFAEDTYQLTITTDPPTNNGYAYFPYDTVEGSTIKYVLYSSVTSAGTYEGQIFPVGYSFFTNTSNFAKVPQKGEIYYCDMNSTPYYHLVTEGATVDSISFFDSVDIDLSSVRAGATLSDIYSSVANSITTTPEDTIEIFDINLTHGSSNSDLLKPTDPLEKGKTYTLWLTLQSADVLFKQDSVSDYALSNLNIDEAYKTVFLDDTYAAADEGKLLDMEIRFTVDSSTPGPNPNPTPKKSASAHVHNFQWQTISAPTNYTDGLEAEVCSICGERRNEQPLLAYGYALNQYATPMINSAQPGQTITFEFGEWNSFPKSFMEKIAAKNDVTYVFKFKYNHLSYTVCIPAGTKVDLKEDWYGPLKLAELYGAIVE